MLPGKCPRDEWHSATAFHASTNCSSIGMQTVSIQYYAAPSDYVSHLQHNQLLQNIIHEYPQHTSSQQLFWLLNCQQMNTGSEKIYPVNINNNLFDPCSRLSLTHSVAENTVQFIEQSTRNQWNKCQLVHSGYVSCVYFLHLGWSQKRMQNRAHTAGKCIWETSSRLEISHKQWKTAVVAWDIAACNMEHISYCQCDQQVPAVNWCESVCRAAQMCSCPECHQEVSRSTKSNRPPVLDDRIHRVRQLCIAEHRHLLNTTTYL